MATQQSFFASVQAFAKPFVKVEQQKDPVQIARTRFAAAADEALADIKAGKDKGFWVKKHGDGWVVQLKNGAKMLAGCSFAVGSTADANKLLEAAKAGAARGEFDEQFKATARVMKAKAEGEAQAPAADAAAETTPAADTAKGKRK